MPRSILLSFVRFTDDFDGKLRVRRFFDVCTDFERFEREDERESLEEVKNRTLRKHVNERSVREKNGSELIKRESQSCGRRSEKKIEDA